jgi:hypothetical protein
VIAIIATAIVVGLLAYLLPSLLATRRVSLERRAKGHEPARRAETDPPDESSESDPLPVGYRLGRFQIREELSPALLGRVYKATDTRQGSTVAINVLAPTLRDQVGRFRFHMSARAAAVFADGVMEVDDIGGIPFAVVQYVDGVGAMVDIGRVPWGRRTRG